MLWAAVTQLQATLKRSAVLVLPKDGDLQLSAAWPPETELGVADMTAVRWAFEEGGGGIGTGTLPTIAFQFRPLTSPHGVIGVCGFAQGSPAHHRRGAGADRHSRPDRRGHRQGAPDSGERETGRAALEGERFRAALLSSISHDLRTPLATITGAVTGAPAMTR